MIPPHTLEAATIAAFTARHDGRPSYTWEGSDWRVQERWRVVVEDVLTGKHTSAAAMRAAYVEGMTEKTWREIRSIDRLLWLKAYDAAVRAAATAQLQEAA